LHGSSQRTRDQGVDLKSGKHSGHRLALLAAEVRELAVTLTLDAAGQVELRLAMPHAIKIHPTDFLLTRCLIESSRTVESH